MTSRRLGSKTDTFAREGQSWICKTGLQSDIVIEVGEASFHLHKFPLLSRSGMLEKLIEEATNEDGSDCVLQLSNIPGGSLSFELVAKFCYGVVIELNALNAVSLRCAADFLGMTEEYGERNLIAQTEAFLNEIIGNWADSIIALKSCEQVMPYVEDLHIVPRFVDSLAVKACTDMSLLNWPLVESNTELSPQAGNGLWNGISVAGEIQTPGDVWWHEDVSFLSLPLYKRLVLAIQSKGMKPENIAASLIYYAKRHIPIMNGRSEFKEANNDQSGTAISTVHEDKERALLEEIVELLPNKKGVTSTKFLLRLLLTAMILRASPMCREILEKRIGSQLEQAALVDILIPNINYLGESLYDLDCVQRILEHFMSSQAAVATSSSGKVDQGQFGNGTNSLSPMTKVASLVDGFLAEVAPDVNLKLPKFQALAALIPDYVRPVSDGIYHAIDVYLKAHPWLTETEREQLCRHMDFQKLSLEASTHAAQNDRLPLRVLVQVVFFEQLKLRTSISGSSYGSENHGGNGQESGEFVSANDVREHVSKLQKECMSMKKELEKLNKPKRSWNIFANNSCFKQKLQVTDPKRIACKQPALPLSVHSLENGEVAH